MLNIDELNWQLDLESNEELQYTIIDAIGSIVKKGSFSEGAIHKISTTNWQSGTYFVQVNVGDKVISKSVTLINND